MFGISYSHHHIDIFQKKLLPLFPAPTPITIWCCASPNAAEGNLVPDEDERVTFSILPPIPSPLRRAVPSTSETDSTQCHYPDITPSLPTLSTGGVAWI